MEGIIGILVLCILFIAGGVIAYKFAGSVCFIIHKIIQKILGKSEDK